MKALENAKAGTLDPSFGENGIVIVDFPNPDDYTRYIRRVTTQGAGPETKIYFAGETTTFSSFDSYFVGRLNDDGTPDNTFGDNGLVLGQFPHRRRASVVSFAIQADGKIVLLAYHADELSTTTLFARFERDGKLDLNFGSNGYTSVDWERKTAPDAPIDDEKQRRTSGNGSLSGIEILPDGKILACNQNNWIVRLTPEGILDNTFNKTGYVRVIHPDYSANDMVLFEVQAQNNGKYVGCGVIVGPPNRSYFVRVDDTGTIDKLFGSSENGFVVMEGSIESKGIRIDRMARQPNQRILGVGATYAFPYENGVMTSIEPNGTPNIQFNRGELLYTNLEDKKWTVWTGAAVQKDGKIVVSGGLGDDSVPLYEVVVARYINETLDPSFGDGRGWITTALPAPGGGYATSMAFQEDGKIVVAATVNEIDKPMILRYLP
ncbi:hypothetical protein D3C76_821110 [compost metagenome]|uniref:hypothetical protein n=1 Tax=Pseudomonas sp. ACN8 TaxID=1920428 RepID=UPI000BB37A29|nr:hypothetical protein [Pseudomonas sp. ACN8]PBJ26232.1 hypothetical protein BSF44_12970 [Pseudomonas sp. ACN8]